MVAIPFGPFVLEKPIGRGGMGEVWKGRHVAQNEPVAVKIMHRETLRTPEYVAAFRNEVRHIAALNHPGVVLVYDYGEVPVDAQEISGGQLVEGSPYLVMEYARKGSLLDLESYLGWSELRSVLLVILDALAHAHARDVIHRDLKPENILVGCGETEAIKLTDFGLAHAADRFRDSSKVEPVWGTPQYMAPEQLRGLWRDYGPWTDLYSLGCMTYQLVCGRFPYTGASVWDIGKAHLTSPIPKIESRIAIPEGLDEWIVRLMQKDRQHRFQTAADASWALQQLAERLDGTSDGVSTPVAATRQGADEAQSGEALTVLLTSAEEAPTIVTPTLTIDLQRWFETDAGQSLIASRAESDGAREATRKTRWTHDRPPMPESWRDENEATRSPHLLGAGLGLYGLRAIPFVDRNAERDRIWELLEAVSREGRCKAMIISGPAGVGKSELARWMSRRAEELGAARVMRATHSPVESPSDGLEAMLSRFLRCTRLAREEVALRLREKFRHGKLGDAYTAQALTELLSPRPLEVEQSGEVPATIRFTSPRQRYALIYSVLEHLARQRPLIIFLDDVQWGAGALAFVHYALEMQNERPAPMLFLMTLRDEGLDERLEEPVLLRQLVEEESVTDAPIGPLGKEDTRELVERLLGLDGELATHVKRRAQGIPLFAVQLVGDWVSRGKLVLGPQGFVLAPGESIEIPDDLHVLWGERLTRVLERYGDEGLVAIEIAAALGQEVSTREWRAACRFGGGQPSARIVEDLVRAGLGEPLEEGWAFSHGMLRESIIRTAKEDGRWGNLNAACAHMLYHLYSPQEYGVAERYGWHMIEAGWPHEALEPFLMAVDALTERSELGRAHRLLDEREDILGRLGPGADPRDACEGWVRRASIMEYEGRYTDALRLASQVAHLAQHHQWEALLAPSMLRQGTAECHLGRLDQAEQNLDAARELFEASFDAEGQARSLIGLGRVAEQRGDFSLAVTFFDAARDIFERGGQLSGVARCLNALGDIARQSGDLALARSYSQQSLQISQNIGYQIGVADSLNDLSELDRLRGDLSSAKAKCLEALTLYQTLGSKKSFFVELNLGLIHLVAGEFDRASEIYEALEMKLRRTQQWSLLPHALIGLMAGYGIEENWQAFDWCHEETLRLIEQTGIHSGNLAIAAGIVADVAASVGEEERARVLRRLQRLQSEAVRRERRPGRIVIGDE